MATRRGGAGRGGAGQGRALFRTVISYLFDDQLKFETQSKKVSIDQELIQSDPTSCPQNQKGNN